MVRKRDEIWMNLDVICGPCQERQLTGKGEGMRRILTMMMVFLHVHLSNKQHGVEIQSVVSLKIRVALFACWMSRKHHFEGIEIKSVITTDSMTAYAPIEFWEDPGLIHPHKPWYIFPGKYFVFIFHISIGSRNKQTRPLFFGRWWWWYVYVSKMVMSSSSFQFQRMVGLFLAQTRQRETPLMKRWSYNSSRSSYTLFLSLSLAGTLERRLERVVRLFELAFNNQTVLPHSMKCPNGTRIHKCLAAPWIGSGPLARGRVQL